MSSQFGFRPSERKTVSTQADTKALDGSVAYVAPAHILSATVESTAAAVTYDAADILGGFILRDCNGGARSDVLPTAANLVSAFKGCVAGSAVRFIVRNTSDGAEAITLVANTGTTIEPSTFDPIAQYKTGEYVALFTNVTPGSEAVVVYTVAFDHSHDAA